MSLSIRQANIQDCPLILKFIRELADYEKLLHEVVADVAALESSLFGDKPHAEVVIAEHQGQPLGFAWRRTRQKFRIRRNLCQPEYAVPEGPELKNRLRRQKRRRWRRAKRRRICRGDSEEERNNLEKMIFIG